jgi:hypothetical protein
LKRTYWLGFLIAFITAIILDMLIDWPSALFAGILTGVCLRKASPTFWIGFGGVGAAWLLMTLVPAIWASTVKLAEKLVQVPGLSAPFAFLMFLLTGLVGGILGGLGAANAAAIYNIIIKRKGNIKARTLNS